MLGDLVSQQHGKLVGLSPELMNCITISEGDRRGAGEGGWVWKPE
ncbi:MAG TPA: hypothetical protein VFW87_00420 [Pirellulales bacterium]|nr:hypothetical protein [Pirellulales bacterium]